jgi:hypothetical protein
MRTKVQSLESYKSSWDYLAVDICHSKKETQSIFVFKVFKFPTIKNEHTFPKEFAVSNKIKCDYDFNHFVLALLL